MTELCVDLKRDISSRRERPLAVLVGAGPRVLTVARSLVSEGMRCIVAATPGQKFSVRSRAIDQAIELDGSPAEAGAMLRLLVLAERASWVVPCGEDALTIIAEVHDDLTGITSVGYPTAEMELLSQLPPGAPSASWQWNDPVPALQEASDVALGWIRPWIKRCVSAVMPRGMLATINSARSLSGGRRVHFVRRRIARRLSLAPRQQLPGTINSVLFVCHGNIMRSAAAGQLLVDALAGSGVTDVLVQSAGAHTSLGRRAHVRVAEAVLLYGTSLEQHRSQPLTRELVDGSDVIFAMDDMNFVDIVAEYPDAGAKVRMLGGIEATSEEGGYIGAEILDPYGRGDEEVSATIAKVHASVSVLQAAILRMRRCSASAQREPL